ncbi:hypothetical protein DOK76_03725 [Vagococcus sp. DIV0080]|uniref:Uncharacterized protein n=1 Tax=Candidatus Vagococcus giribetii TaxID=2230876 RepID=A0ABS3HS64_9ENTE|nr:hypothetical protein [Vagococcus sp. DIV0080]MBO0476165.1 hypothetical protein [Vagococcus sp. DIV0080]
MITNESKELINQEIQKYTDLKDVHAKYKNLASVTKVDFTTKKEQLAQEPSLELSQEVTSLERLLEAYENKVDSSKQEYDEFVKNNNASLRRLGNNIMEHEIRDMNPMFKEMKQLSDCLSNALELSEVISTKIHQHENDIRNEVNRLSDYKDSDDFSIFPKWPWINFLFTEAGRSKLETMKKNIDDELESHNK